MPASPHIRPSKDKDAAVVLVELLKPLLDHQRPFRHGHQPQRTRREWRSN
jgi:hypothetical protein